MRKGIGEAVGESGDPPVHYPKDLSFIGYTRETLLRLPRLYLVIIISLGALLLAIWMASMIFTSSSGPDLYLIGSMAILALVMPLVMIVLLTPLVYLYFRFQRIFRQFNRVFFDGSNIVIDHTEWPNSPWIRNSIPIASVSLVSPAGSDFWTGRKGVGTFGEKLRYPSHLPPEGGLYHSYSEPKDLFIIYLGREQEIETPNRKTRMFHTIWSYKVWVKEIVVAVGKDHQEDFLRALNRKGVKIKRPRAEPQPTFIEKQAIGGSVRFG